eukprot:7659017-Pyramimonas_sp.AAC.1
MGGGLLQKVDRDTMKFSSMLGHVKYKGEQTGRDVLKAPVCAAKGGGGGFSLPGVLQVGRRGVMK